MGKNFNPQCKQCRREGEKLFLKGERCYSSKCAIVKRNYPPGLHGPKKGSRLTGYGRQLREKQKAKKIYYLSEKQFRNYYEAAASKLGDTGEILLQFLELRLDNVIHRLGFTKSQRQARQLVNHAHFLVNEKKVNIPSYQLKPKDVISIRQGSLKSPLFSNLSQVLEKQEIAPWLNLDTKELKARVLDKPAKDKLQPNFDIKLIIEYYSR